MSLTTFPQRSTKTCDKTPCISFMLLLTVASALLLFVACASTPETFQDPRGEFIITYPSDWEDTTIREAEEFAKSSNDFEIAFSATRFDSGDSERLISPIIPTGWILVKRGEKLPSYWAEISSDREFLEEWAGQYDYTSEPAAENYNRPVEIVNGDTVGLEMETTYSKTVSIRRFFRLHRETVLEVICASIKGRWGSSKNVCQDMFNTLIINGGTAAAVTAFDQSQIDAASEELYWGIAEIVGVSTDLPFKDANDELTDILMDQVMARLNTIQDNGFEPFEKWPYCLHTMEAINNMGLLIRADSPRDAGGIANYSFDLMKGLDEMVKLSARDKKPSKPLATDKQCDELAEELGF